MALESDPEDRSGGFALRLVRGLAEAAAVLVVAVAAGFGLLYILKQQHLDLAATAPWFAALISSFSLIAFYGLNRRKESAGLKAINAKLKGGLKTKSDLSQLRVDLDLSAKEFKDKCERYAKTHDEFMLVCRQIKGDKGEKKYSTDEIREQVLFLKEKRPHPDVKWVVFTTNDNAFVAFQEFDTFLAFVLNEQAGRYREALNAKEAADSRAMFEDMTRSEASRTYTPGAPDEGVVIFGLNPYCIEQGKSRKEMIHFMEEKKIGEVMVVKAKKPMGVVRLSQLVSSVFGDVL